MSLDKLKSNGVLPLVALDHRGSLKRLLKSSQPDKVSKEEVQEWKGEILSELMKVAPAVLLDVDYGLSAYKDLKINKPYLLAIEKSGYTGNKENKKTELEHTVGKLKKLGAEAVKLLIYYNPDNEASIHQHKIIKKVAGDCQKNKIPFLLEIVTYNIGTKKRTKESLVMESLNNIISLRVKVDVYKLEFPGGVATSKAGWASKRRCQEITGILGETPWILLSAGADYDKFKKQVDIATKAGAKGFLAGRALWQDFKKYKDRQKFFKQVATKRLKEITAIACKNQARD